MVRILVQALVKGEQLGMFGGAGPKPAAPKPVAAGTPVNVKAHMRVGAHGVELVTQHERHVVKATPKAEPSKDPGEFDASKYAREVLRLKRAEIDERLKGMADDDPRRKVIEAELERRGAKREAKYGKPAEKPAPTEAPPKTTDPDFDFEAHDQRLIDDQVAARPRTAEQQAGDVPVEEPKPPESGADQPGDAYLKKVDDAMASAKPGAWKPLLDLYAHESRHDELSAWLDKYAPDAGTARDLLNARDDLPSTTSLDDVAKRIGVKPIAKPEPPKAAEPEAPAPKSEPKVEAPPTAEPEKPAAPKAEEPKPEKTWQELQAEKEKRGEGEIRDIGEVVWGARKHKWKRGEEINTENLDQVEALGENEAQKAVTKEAVFGKYDHEADRALGDSPGASFMKAQIIAAVGSAPAADRESRAWYVEGAQWLKGALQQLHTVDEVTEFLSDWKLMDGGIMRQDETYTTKELLEHLKPFLGEVSENARGEREYAGTRGGRGSSGSVFVYDTSDKVPETNRNIRTGEMETRMRSRLHRIPMDVLTSAGYAPTLVRRRGRDGDEVYAFTKPVEADVGNQRVATTESGDRSVVVVNSNPYRQYLIALTGIASSIDMGKVKELGEEQRWASLRDGMGALGTIRRMQDPLNAEIARVNKALRSHRLSRAVHGVGALHDKLRDAQQMEKDGKWDSLLGEKAKQERGPRLKWTRADAPIERSGGAAMPANVEGETLKKKFNFRGVQYGNWVDQTARSEHLSHAYGAFSDLADIMGVEPETVTHGGRLAIAFGARGGGKANAHYEALEQVINLTNTRGAGTLAHEWGHFFDNIMTANPQRVVGLGSSRRPQFMSESDRPHEDVHSDVVAAYTKVMEAIHKPRRSDRFHELQGKLRAADFDTRNKARQEIAEHRKTSPDEYMERSRFVTDASSLGDYWARNHELFARAFESYVEDKLHDKKQLNTYLVSGTRVQYKIPRAGETREPYPQGEERKAINAAMENLTQTMARHRSLRKAMERIFIRSRIALA